MPHLQQGLDTITCPNCGQTLPAQVQTCQFCHTDVQAVSRPVSQQFRPSGPAPAGNWQLVAYYVMGGWWLANGTFIALAFVGSLIVSLLHGAGLFVIFPLLGFGIGAALAATGLGLLLKWEWARGVVNVLCWIMIAFGLLRLVMSLLAGFVLGPLAILMAFYTVFNIAMAGFQIYLIGETDKFM